MDEQVIKKRRQGKKEGRMFETDGAQKDMGLMYMYMNMATVATGRNQINQLACLPGNLGVRDYKTPEKCLVCESSPRCFFIGRGGILNYSTPGMCSPKWRVIPKCSFQH